MNIFYQIVEMPILVSSDKSICEALEALVNAAMDYSDAYTVEFNKGNMAVHPERDELILLDPLFDLDEVRQAHAAARKRARGY